MLTKLHAQLTLETEITVIRNQRGVIQWHTLHCAGADGMSGLYIMPCRCTEINETILNSFAVIDISAGEWHCTRCQKVKVGHE